jgi:hypothetical protein
VCSSSTDEDPGAAVVAAAAAEVASSLPVGFDDGLADSTVELDVAGKLALLPETTVTASFMPEAQWPVVLQMK